MRFHDFRDALEDGTFRRQLDELSIVLIGSLGCGKSSSGNSILGRKRFKIATGTIAITTKVETESVIRGNLRIRVIDTPGLQNSSDFLKLRDVLKRSFKDHPTENVTYALVIQVGRYTQEEKQLIEDIFKKNRLILKNTVIIFTNREALYDEDNPSDQTIDCWLKKNPSLLSLIQTYKLKYRAFQNKRLLEAENDIQVRDLITAICEEDQPVTVCPVNDSKKKKMNLIYVSREQMGEKFGTYGTEFFEDQFIIQKNVHDYDMK